MKRLVLLTAAVTLASMLAGCGGASTSGSSTARNAVVRTVVVKESEFELVSSSVSLKKPGTYVFKAENVGSDGHALEIEGNGVETRTSVLAQGKSTEMKVKLKPGTYEMYCPVDDHEDRGMKAKITVAGDGDSGGGGGLGGGY